MVHLTSRLRLLVSLLTVICALAVACAPVAAPPPTNVPATSGPAPTNTSAPPTAAPTTTLAPATAAPTSTAAPTAVPLAVPTVAIPTATSASASATFPVTVTDDAGRKVTFSAAPQRIISISPGLTESLYALGAGDRVIVTDQYSDFPAENQSKAKLNTYPKPNVEEIVSLKPDLIVVLVEGDDFIQQMAAQKIPILKIFPTTFDNTLKDILLLGQVTGTTPKAEQITANMRERADAVTAKTKNAPKVSVLYELDASDATKPFVAGPAGFFGSLVPLAGGKNIFDDLGGPSGQVSSEQIVSRNPDIIILGDSNSPYNAQTPDLVRARSGWNQINAVKNGRIYPLNDAFLSRPGPRLIDGLEQMAKIIHPELFP
jgi:iron complex transport system substrate-binding protein